MNKALVTMAAFLLLAASSVLFYGCAGQTMNDPPMHGTADTMSEETMKPGKDTMMDSNSGMETMQNTMQENSMENNIK